MKYQNENFNGTCDFRSGFHDGWYVEQHLHEYSELIYCKSGECDIFVNQRKLSLREKQLAWIPPNYVHSYDCHDAVVVCAVFSNDMIPLFFKALENKRLIVSAVDVGEMSDILDGFYLLEKERYLQISGYLNLIAAKVLEASEFESADKGDGVLYQKVISYIFLHFTEDIALQSLAKQFGYNEKYLSHALHQLSGINFRQLLSLYRINHAKELLITKRDTNVSEIAIMCGFSAFNTFHRAFRAMTGMTPTEYREQYRI